MILRRNVAAGVGLLLAPLAVGATVVHAPQLAIIACALVVLAVIASYGAPALLGATVAVFPIIPSKFHVAGLSAVYPQRVLVGLLIAVVAIEPQLWSRQAQQTRLLGAPLRFFVAFLAVGLVSAAVSPLGAAAISGLGFYAFQVAGVMLAGCVLARTARAEEYLQAISIGAITVTLLAVAEYLAPTGAVAHLLGPVYSSNSTSHQVGVGVVRALPFRVSGPFPDPVSLGGYAVFTLPFALRAAVSRLPRCARLGKTAVVMLAGALMLSETRMAMLAVPVVLAVFFAISDRRRGVLVIAAVTSVAVLATFGPSVIATQGRILGSAVSYRGQATSPNPAVQSIAGRLSLYQTGWRAFRQQPLVGYGLRVPTQHSQSTVFTQYGESYAFESYAVILPLEVGALGVLAFLAFIAGLVRAVWRYCPIRADRAAICAALAGGAVLAIGANPFDIEVTYLWLLIGVFLGTGMKSAADRAGAPAAG